ncbi:MAG: DUF975 family protein [Oscillospiraceae bacterium]|nr:DUF975 family protein [Oscillospiraceae bacterium]
MWTRSLLKQNAWNSLKEKGYYWNAFLVCLLTGLFVDGSGGSVSSSSSANFQNEFPTGEMTEEEHAIIIGAIITFIVVFVIALAIAFVISAFVGGPMEAGRANFFIKAREGDTSLMHMFDNFGSGKYMPTVKTMFARYLYTFLWSLLFVIPGIIKTYEYHLIPYLMAENPNLPKERAFEISRRAMDGEKWKLFVLQLSFIGWYLLGALVCCGSVFVSPYEQATMAEFYACMRAKIIAQGISTEEELTGGMNGFGGGMISGQITSAQNPYDM